MMTGSVRVAEATGPDAKRLGVEWIEARMRTLSSAIDKKGVATSSRHNRIGLAMDYIAHGPSGQPIIVGALALDVGGIARLPKEPTAMQLAATLATDQPAVRVSRRGEKPKPKLTLEERAAMVRLVLASFRNGGKSPSEASVRPATAARSKSSAKPQGVSIEETIRPCADDGEPVPSGESCVDGKAPPTGCFDELCNIGEPEAMGAFTRALEDSLNGAYKNKECVEFVIALGAAAADTAILVDGPLEVLIAAGAAALGRRCAIKLLEGIVTNMVKNGMLDELKTSLCASRDSYLPRLDNVKLDGATGFLIEILSKLTGLPSTAEVQTNYDAVVDVFNTVRQCTCGYASANAGQDPVRAQRVVDADGNIACLPCAPGSSYDPESLVCVPDQEGNIIAICTEGGELATTTPCGEQAPEVRVIEPELCLDVWVTEYTAEQAATGALPQPRLETVRVPSNGASFTASSTIAFTPSFDQCAPAGATSDDRLQKSIEDFTDADLQAGSVATQTTEGVGMYETVLSPFPGPDGQQSYFPGHACAVDASGTTRCIDSVPVDYLVGSVSGAAPGFYWCDYQGSKCRDAIGAGRNTPPPRAFPSYWPRGYATDTCANPVDYDDLPADPPSRDLLEDDCTGKTDGVHCSVAEDNRAGGIRCKGGVRVAEVRCQGDLVCVETPNVDQIQCESPLSKTDCGDKTDGWWCLDVAGGTPWMAYCSGKQISGGCACGSCTMSGVKAACSASPPPAACPL